MDARQFDKCIHDSGRIFRSHEDIQIAECVTHPSQASGRLGIDDSLHLFKFTEQRLRDWVDQVLNSVAPVGPYAVKTIGPENGTTRIKVGCVVLVVALPVILIRRYRRKKKRRQAT